MTRNSKFRQLVFERDEKCQDCGTTEDLEAHHIVPLSLGGEDTPENGIALCFDCHNNRHTGELTSFALSWPTRMRRQKERKGIRKVKAQASVMLYTMQIAYLDEIGHENISAGIRLVTDTYPEEDPQGRPAAIDRSLTDSLMAVSVTLYPEQISFLKELGKGKVSRGIRIVTDAHMQRRDDGAEEVS